MTTARDVAIVEAAEALSDLNTFGIVVSILEGGHIHSPSYKDGQRIIDICKSAMGKRLREYDRARAKANQERP